MDFRVGTENGTGLGAMSFDPATDIWNNIWLSLMIRKGSWFQNPDFGSRLHLLQRAKNTEKTAALAREYCKEATQWLIDTGRATSIEVATERDVEGHGMPSPYNPHRLKCIVEAVQADGRRVTFETFVAVV